MFGHSQIVDKAAHQVKLELGLDKALEDIEGISLHNTNKEVSEKNSSNLKTHLSVLPYFKSYHKIWSDKGTGAKMNLSLFRLTARMHVAAEDGGGYQNATKQGYRILGDVASRGHHDSPPGRTQTFIIREDSLAEFEEFVRKPLDYKKIWTEEGTGCRNPVSIWQPVPPPGFVALGHIVTPSHETPDTDLMRCVHHSITEKGKLTEEPIWTDRRSGGKRNVSLWRVEPLDDKGLKGNLFLAVNTYDRPVGTPRVLSTRCVLVDAQTDQEAMPVTLRAGDLCPKCNGAGSLGVFGVPSVCKLDNPVGCVTCDCKGTIGHTTAQCPECKGKGGTGPYGPCSSNSLFYKCCNRCGGSGYMGKDRPTPT